MSLLPRNFLINGAYLTELGGPIKPAVYVEPPKPPKDDWSCAVASDNPPKPKATLVDAARAVSAVLAKRKPVPKSARPFQVGDLVRVLDGSKISNYAGGWVLSSMEDLVGNTYRVSKTHELSDGRTGVHLMHTIYTFDARGLALVEAAK